MDEENARKLLLVQCRRPVVLIYKQGNIAGWEYNGKIVVQFSILDEKCFELSFERGVCQEKMKLCKTCR